MNNNNVTTSNMRLFAPDFIRVISFFMIVLFHYNVEIYYNYPGFLKLGELSYFGQTMGDVGISMFIIISGLSLVISTKDNNDYVLFLKKRVLAIFPSFWISYLIVAALMLIIKGSFVGDGHYWKFILSIIGLDGFFLYRMQNYYLVGEWYTGYMIITYLFFPVLYEALKKMPVIAWGVVSAIFFAVGLNYQKLFSVYINCNPLMRLPDFLFGMSYAFFILKDKKNRLYAMLAGMLALAIAVPARESIMPQLYMLIFGVSLFSIAVYLIEFLGSIDWLRKITSYFAKHAFVAFLFHHQILYFVMSKIGGRISSGLESLCVFLFILFSSVVMAILTEPLVRILTKKMRAILLPSVSTSSR